MAADENAQNYGSPSSNTAENPGAPAAPSVQPEDKFRFRPETTGVASTIPNLSQNLDEPQSPTAVPNPYPAETDATFYTRYPQLHPQARFDQDGNLAQQAPHAGSPAGGVDTTQPLTEPHSGPSTASAYPNPVQPGYGNDPMSPTSPAQPALSAPSTTVQPTPTSGSVAGTTQHLPGPEVSASGRSATKTGRSGPRWLPVVLVSALVAALISVSVPLGLRYFHNSNTSSATAPVQPGPVTPPSADSANLADWVKVAEAVRPSVVAIQASGGGTSNAGSGVIFDDQAHLITNHHVISRADPDKIEVFLVDGRVYPATLVGSDPTTDLAVLQIQNAPADLVKANLGTSQNLRVGQPVAAIGNPLQLASTMTTGIISALDRPVTVQERTAYTTSDPVITNAIQVDASINPGNSGGPLFDASGTVIGINSSIITTSSQPNSPGGSIGLGFAIPIDLVKSITQQLLENGKVAHAFIGVFLADGTVEVDGVRYTGAYLRQIVPGSAADKAGLEEGDVVLTINGSRVTSGESLTGYVRRYRPGDTVTLEVGSESGKREVQVVLGDHPEL